MPEQPKPGYNHRYTQDQIEQMGRDTRFKEQADYLARRTGEENYRAFFGGRPSGAALLLIILGLAIFGAIVLGGVYYWAIGQYH